MSCLFILIWSDDVGERENVSEVSGDGKKALSDVQREERISNVGGACKRFAV